MLVVVIFNEFVNETLNLVNEKNICFYIYLYIYIHTYIHIHTYIYTYTYIYTVWIYTYTHIYIYMIKIFDNDLKLTWWLLIKKDYFHLVSVHNSTCRQH